MSLTAMNVFNRNLILNLSTDAKLIISYVAAHITAISTIGTMYLLGLFDAGFLSQESLIVKLAKQIIATIA